MPAGSECPAGISFEREPFHKGRAKMGEFGVGPVLKVNGGVLNFPGYEDSRPSFFRRSSYSLGTAEKPQTDAKLFKFSSLTGPSPISIALSVFCETFMADAQMRRL